MSIYQKSPFTQPQKGQALTLASVDRLQDNLCPCLKSLKEPVFQFLDLKALSGPQFPFLLNAMSRGLMSPSEFVSLGTIACCSAKDRRDRRFEGNGELVETP
jgi:hypothetical protein